MCSFASTYFASVSAPGLYSTTDSAAASDPVPVTLLPIWNPIALSFDAVSRARFGIDVPFTTVTVTSAGFTDALLVTFSSVLVGSCVFVEPLELLLLASLLPPPLSSLLASWLIPYAAPPPSTSAPATIRAMYRAAGMRAASRRYHGSFGGLVGVRIEVCEVGMRGIGLRTVG